MTTQVMCVTFPDWPVQRAQAESANDASRNSSAKTEPDVRPLVLYRALPQGGLKVAACCDAATGSGVFGGMTLAEANVLVPAARFLEHDENADLQMLKRLAIDCQRFSPLVGVDTNHTETPPDSLLLDITGCSHLFGGEDQLAARLVEMLRERSFSVQLGLGETVGEAWARAHFAAATLDGSNPGEPTALAAGRENLSRRSTRPRLAPLAQVPLETLPIEALRISAKAADSLRNFGIKCIDQLTKLPRKSLPSRFGKQVLARLDQAFGSMSEVIEPERSLGPIRVEWSFEYPTTHRETIDTVIQRLLRQLAEQLVPRCEGVLQYNCRIHCEPAAPIEYEVGVVEATQSPELLFDMLDLHLDSLHLSGPVTDISITSQVLVPISIRQQQLFEPEPQHAESQDLSALINRLSNRMGSDAIVQPRLVADAQPEAAFEMQPMVEAAQDRARRSTNSDSLATDGCLPRPLRVAREPKQIQVETSPTGHLQRISGLADTGQRFRVNQSVVSCDGPERIETGWWREEYIRRDYYRVETDDGSRLWIFQDRKTGDWFQHGAFA